MNPPFCTTFSPASNANHTLHSPLPAGFQQWPMSGQPPQQHFPFMMMHPPMQPQMQFPGYPMYPFPAHNFPLMAIRHPFFAINQLPVVPSPSQSPQVCAHSPSPSTPSRTMMHNTSLNASLLGSSLNDSHRFNPLGRGGRSRDHSIVDQNSSDRSFQQSYVDPRELAGNSDLVSYCIIELSRAPLTEEELVAKVSKSRRFKKFGVHNLPEAVSTILKTLPCFISRTVILRTSPNDVQPVSKTIWKSDKRYQRSRGNKLNATMFEIPERNTGGGEVLSVLGDIESLKIDEKPPRDTVDEKPPRDTVDEKIV